MLNSIKRSFILSALIIVFFVSFNISNASLTEDQAACNTACPSGSNCTFLPKCKTGCNNGCQPGYYLSDGDGDHTNNCIEVDSSNNCIKSNVKGICEICPPGFYCKGGMKDKIACAKGTYTDTPGAIQSSDCKTPELGYCVAKAKLVGTETATIPSVCIETPLNGLSNTDVKDIDGAVNTSMPNDEGIKGYTLSNSLGANIVIPCPLGTYDTRTNTNTGNASCKYPSAGYCTSYDGVSCTFYEASNGGGVTLISNTDIKSAILTSARFGDCADGSKPNSEGKCANGAPPTKIYSGLGSTKQTPCPIGTYDLRTKVAGGYYNNPSPFCVYPDAGKKTITETTGNTNQNDCVAGKYDARGGLTNSKHSFCEPCPVGNYCPNTAMTSYIYCAPGSYTNTLGSTGATTCTSCPAGTYDGDSNSATSCNTCSENYYCTGGLTSQIPCSAGITWSNAGWGSCANCEWSGYSTSCEGDSVIRSRRSVTSGNASCNVSLVINGDVCKYCSNPNGVCYTTVSDKYWGGCGHSRPDCTGGGWYEYNYGSSSCSWGRRDYFDQCAYDYFCQNGSNGILYNCPY